MSESGCCRAGESLARRMTAVKKQEIKDSTLLYSVSWVRCFSDLFGISCLVDMFACLSCLGPVGEAQQ